MYQEKINNEIEKFLQNKEHKGSEVLKNYVGAIFQAKEITPQKHEIEYVVQKIFLWLRNQHKEDDLLKEFSSVQMGADNFKIVKGIVLKYFKKIKIHQVDLDEKYSLITEMLDGDLFENSIIDKLHDVASKKSLINLKEFLQTLRNKYGMFFDYLRTSKLKKNENLLKLLLIIGEDKFEEIMTLLSGRQFSIPKLEVFHDATVNNKIQKMKKSKPKIQQKTLAQVFNKTESQIKHLLNKNFVNQFAEDSFFENEMAKELLNFITRKEMYKMLKMLMEKQNKANIFESMNHEKRKYIEFNN